ncbi:MAG: hypothetical protein J6P73_00050 [Bacteroidales bacterium]|nr:hypothetical protein [Bacteroidales bacterium]
MGGKVRENNKALLIPIHDGFSAIAFMIENSTSDQDLKRCACTIDELERVLDKDLFCLLENRLEKKTESVIVWEDWGL